MESDPVSITAIAFRAKCFLCKDYRHMRKIRMRSRSRSRRRSLLDPDPDLNIIICRVPRYLSLNAELCHAICLADARM
jgi:hypothetical protein